MKKKERSDRNPQRRKVMPYLSWKSMQDTKYPGDH